MWPVQAYVRAEGNMVPPGNISFPLSRPSMEVKARRVCPLQQAGIQFVPHKAAFCEGVAN